MYPKVFADYAAAAAPSAMSARCDGVSFTDGPGQEINIDLERGKTLIVRYVTTSDPHEDGTRTVFFELNGQPRPIRVTDRSQVAKRPPRRKPSRVTRATWAPPCRVRSRRAGACRPKLARARRY